MPEGPEVKRCGDILRDRLLGKTITSIESLSDKGKFKDIKGVDKFSPSTVIDVFVVGKVIVCYLKDLKPSDHPSLALISTLGMAGWWYPPVNQLDEQVANRSVYYNGKPVTASSVIEKALKSARLKIVCSDGTEMYYCDQRNFGNFTICTEDEANSKLDSLGIDVMTLRQDYQLEQAANSIIQLKADTPIADALVDQSSVAGIGNIYRAETLYLSKIHPLRTLESLSTDEITNILMVGQAVLENAYFTESSMRYPVKFVAECLGSDLGEKVSSSASRMNYEYIPGHLVYGRTQDIFGHKVQTAKLGGRTLWFVPEVQK